MIRPLVIAVDYDGTITADPEMFHAFMIMMQERGHTVLIATMRYEGEPLHIAHVPEGVRIYYTGRRAKREALQELYGIVPDIWIDDRPFWVENHAGDYIPLKQE